MAKQKKLYIGFENWSGKFRVRVKGTYVGRFTTFDKALRARNKFLKDSNIHLAKGL
ncbi:hypothetical protein [Caudoviricetes sp.]|nr:hypothetical protein [Caudoviricetes sp.]